MMVEPAHFEGFSNWRLHCSDEIEEQPKEEQYKKERTK
jgi:hypothetical protein